MRAVSLDLRLSLRMARMGLNIAISPPACCSLTVVLAAKGYPGSYAKGSPITNLEAVTGAKVFHAGTAMKDDHVVRACSLCCVLLVCYLMPAGGTCWPSRSTVQPVWV